MNYSVSIFSGIDIHIENLNIIALLKSFGYTLWLLLCGFLDKYRSAAPHLSFRL